MSGHGSGEKMPWMTKVINGLEHLTEILEIALSIVIMVGFVLSFIPLLEDLPMMFANSSTEPFEHFLEKSFNLVIGIEFVRMLIKHTPGAALEVLLFAIARHMVLGGGNGIENLLGVCAIAGIFAIRKYLYVHSFQSRHDDSAYNFVIPEGMMIGEAIAPETHEGKEKKKVHRDNSHKETAEADRDNNESAQAPGERSEAEKL